MKRFRIFCILTILGSLQVGATLAQSAVKQGNPVPVNFCINDTVMKLYRMINSYRLSHNLAPVTLSKSLCYVAGLHAKDLFLNHPDRNGCNSYSWSDKSNLWKPFCYPRDENKKSSVWDKPRELTRYPAKAYEMVYWENNALVADTVMMVWKTEDFFNSFLLTGGKWQGKTWNAIGIAVFENYACAWFGEAADPEGAAYVCGTKPEKTARDTVPRQPKTPVPAPVKPGKTGKAKSINHKADSLQKVSQDSLKSSPVNISDKVQADAITPNDSTITSYYIIIKTNLTKKTAQAMADTLRVNTYPQAKVLDQDGKIRLSVYDSPDKAAIMAKLKDVKRTYRDAWLMKR
jgi:hypothetical protein